MGLRRCEQRFIYHHNSILSSEKQPMYGKNKTGHTSLVSRKKEEIAMNCHANKCIECTVKSCAYHCDTENYCSLDRILVGTHEANPTMDQCTDCKSFRKK